MLSIWLLHLPHAFLPHTHVLLDMKEHRTKAENSFLTHLKAECLIYGRKLSYPLLVSDAIKYRGQGIILSHLSS